MLAVAYKVGIQRGRELVVFVTIQCDVPAQRVEHLSMGAPAAALNIFIPHLLKTDAAHRKAVDQRYYKIISARTFVRHVVNIPAAADLCTDATDFCGLTLFAANIEYRDHGCSAPPRFRRGRGCQLVTSLAKPPAVLFSL